MEQVENLAKLAIDKFGKIDVWLNNAGMPQSLLKQKKIEEWDAMIDINIKGTLYGIGAAHCLSWRHKNLGILLIFHLFPDI